MAQANSSTDVYVYPDDTQSLVVRIKSSSSLARCVAVFSVLCFIGCVVLATLYGLEVSRKSEPIPTPKPLAVCDSLTCFYQAIDLVKRMNKSVNPCQDFYSYACGGWQKLHALHGNQTYTSGFLTLSESNYNVLKQALQDAPANYSANEAVIKTVQVYKSCLNTSAVESRGIQPLRDLIRQYGGWRVSGNNSGPVLSTVQRMGMVARDLDVDSFLGIRARADIYDSTKVILQFVPATLGMSYQYYTSTDPDKRKIRDAYLTYMKSVGKILGGVSGEMKMVAIYNFEMKLAKIASGKDPDDELFETILSLRRSSRAIPDFRKSLYTFCADSGFSCSFLKEFLGIVFKRDISGYEKVLSVNKKYFSRLSSLYNSFFLDRSTIDDFIMWKVVNKYIIAMPTNLRTLKENFLTAISGSPPKPRWKQCIEYMMKPLDMPLGLLFVDAHFDEDSKKTVEEMTELIREAFINKLPSQSWMDSSTQAKAKEKALAIKEDVGYPAFIKDPVKLAAKYKMFNPSDSLFDNTKAVNHYLRLKNVNTYGKPVDKDEWFNGPAQVNGYYSPNQNRIVFLAGIIQPPFYEPKFPRYLKYGAIGMVIGHEITHGFDSSGRLYNKWGNLEDWWSTSSTYNFASRAMCLVKQYNRYKVFDKYVNGTITLNENIADNGGIKIAYEAYKLWTKKHGQEKILPGLGLSPEQLFFVGMAQPWCSIYTKVPAYLQLQSDSHSFNKYRVLGPLSNYDKFSQAFKCPSDSPMNPSSKCSVW